MRSQLAMTLGAAVLAWITATPLAAAQDGPPPAVLFTATEETPNIARARSLLETLAQKQDSLFVDLVRKPESPPQTAKFVQQAIEAYGALRYDEVLRLLKSAHAEATASGGRGLSPRELSDVYVYRGLVRRQRSDGIGAWNNFVRAATLAPARRLDPLRFPPSALTMFERAQKSVRAAPFTRVDVQLADGCDAWIDSRKVAATDKPELPTGEHFVRIVCPNSKPFGGVMSWTKPEHNLAMQLPKLAPVSLEEIRRVAEDAGARSFVWIDVRPSTNAGRALRMRFFEADAATAREQMLAPLDKPDLAARALAAMLKRANGKTPTIVAPLLPAPSPWYKKPWVWGAVGAVIATAIILPLTLRSDSPVGFDLILVGP